jgi:hypothetical protein
LLQLSFIKTFLSARLKACDVFAKMGCEPWLPEKYPAKTTKKENIKPAVEEIDALIKDKNCNPILASPFDGFDR